MEVFPTNLFVQNRGQEHGDFARMYSTYSILAKIMLHFINSQKVYLRKRSRLVSGLFTQWVDDESSPRFAGVEALGKDVGDDEFRCVNAGQNVDADPHNDC